MPQRLLVVPHIGEIVLRKRRSSNNIRLSVSRSGQIRVGMPAWTPYNAGLLFVKQHQEWILDQLAKHAPKTILPGHRIGQSHRVVLYKSSAGNGDVDVRVTAAEIRVTTLLNPILPAAQAKIRQGCERALKQQSERLLPGRVSTVSRAYDLPYQNVRIRKLTSRWGSCTSQKDITLSYFLIQLTWELIDYVILHELAHTLYHNHSPRFWAFMAAKQPNLKQLRKQIKSYSPRVEPF